LYLCLYHGLAVIVQTVYLITACSTFILGTERKEAKQDTEIILGTDRRQAKQKTQQKIKQLNNIYIPLKSVLV
jgi:hypothetical protein